MHCFVALVHMFLIEAQIALLLRWRGILLTIMTKIIFEVVEVMGNKISVEIRIEQLDWLIREIYEEKECQDFVQQVNSQRLQMKEAEKYFNLRTNQVSKLKRS